MLCATAAPATTCGHATTKTARSSNAAIDPTVMPTLFDPVRQVPPGEYEPRGRKLFSNAGLGLTICRKLAAAMGSQLRVETQLAASSRLPGTARLCNAASQDTY